MQNYSSYLPTDFIAFLWASSKVLPLSILRSEYIGRLIMNNNIIPGNPNNLKIPKTLVNSTSIDYLVCETSCVHLYELAV